MPDLFRGVLPILVLRTLSDGELYGYEILRRIRAGSSGLLRASEGSLYPVLHRLEAEGALEASWRASDRGPNRRYYRLTGKGGQLLASYEREWASVQVVLGTAAPNGTT